MSGQEGFKLQATISATRCQSERTDDLRCGLGSSRYRRSTWMLWSNLLLSIVLGGSAHTWSEHDQGEWKDIELGPLSKNLSGGVLLRRNSLEAVVVTSVSVWPTGLFSAAYIATSGSSARLSRLSFVDQVWSKLLTGKLIHELNSDLLCHWHLPMKFMFSAIVNSVGTIERIQKIDAHQSPV